jgi:hypothetical protein
MVNYMQNVPFLNEPAIFMAGFCFSIVLDTMEAPA